MNNAGQGLLETIIAIGVIVTGMVGGIVLINFTLRSSEITADRLVALNLSWEAIEVAVNLRDSNLLAGDPFDEGLNGGGDTTAIFSFDDQSNTWLIDFTPSTLQDPATKIYQQGGIYKQGDPQPVGLETPFRRLVILDASFPGEVRVISTVQWSERGNTRLVTTERVLYDWR